MRPSDVLIRATDYLHRHGVDDARSSAEILLAGVLATDRAGIYARADALTDTEARSFGRALCQRCSGVPVQHLIGDQPFREIIVEVRPGVFVPRPETEVLVEVARDSINGRRAPVVADLGTGTGAIALAIKRECPAASVHAVDLSGEACALARDNAARLDLEITVHEGDFYDALPAAIRGTIDCIVSNPPYIAASDYEDLPVEVRADPRSALVGGLPVYERLVSGAGDWLRTGGVLVVEIGAEQGADVAVIFGRVLSDVQITPDLGGRDRIVSGSHR